MLSKYECHVYTDEEAENCTALVVAPVIIFTFKSHRSTCIPTAIWTIVRTSSSTHGQIRRRLKRTRGLSELHRLPVVLQVLPKDQGGVYTNASRSQAKRIWVNTAWFWKAWGTESGIGALDLREQLGTLERRRLLQRIQRGQNFCQIENDVWCSNAVCEINRPSLKQRTRACRRKLDPFGKRSAAVRVDHQGDRTVFQRHRWQRL